MYLCLLRQNIARMDRKGEKKQQRGRSSPLSFPLAFSPRPCVGRLFQRMTTNSSYHASAHPGNGRSTNLVDPARENRNNVDGKMRNVTNEKSGLVPKHNSTRTATLRLCRVLYSLFLLVAEILFEVHRTPAPLSSNEHDGSSQYRLYRIQDRHGAIDL